MSLYQTAIHRYPDSYTAQIMALDAHCSNLNTRLLAALDSIEAIRLGHKQELDDLQHRMHILHARYRVLKHRVKLAEDERDELREGVERLIEKVEIANDYRVLPHASMHFSSPLEPINVRSCQRQDFDHLPNASPLITMLVSQLAFIKKSHKQLRYSSDAKIALLEAQLARRDFELQSCRPCTCFSSHAHGSQPKAVSPTYSGARKSSFTKIVGPPSESNPPLQPSHEESLKILTETSNRQRNLEIEVAFLHEKLDHEKRVLSEALGEPPSDLNFPGGTDNRPVLTSTVPKDHTIPQIAETTEIYPPGIDQRELQTERDNILRFAHPTNNRDDEHFRQSLLLEDECIRLRKSEHELRQKLLLASATEQAYKTTISNLQKQFDAQSNTHDVSIVDDTVTSPAMVNLNRVQIELEEARADADRRQIAIEEVRNQIFTLLQRQQERNVPETG